MTSCAGAESPERTPKTSSASPTPSATASATATATESVEEAVAAAAEQMRTAATGRNAPGPQGLLVAAESTGGALFVWETPDGRFCHGAAKPVGMTMVACASAPHTPPVGEKPRIIPLVTMMATGWNVVFGAEHETVESVTCNGVPLPVKDVGVVADGRRSVHAIEFPDLTLGTVDVRVRRGSRVVTESLSLMSSWKEGKGNFAICGKP
ncbi:hypothetical protein HHL19_23045 [Streptomyces sp. R302]|uniref:hypothetical protein n=1 Tax=unclassified Streptomyces TaxID=2593676 RepID=UPI00145D0DFB|nr:MULTISPECIES: hypothetical protein [unclassified Streptomyces]NML51826.1 hypothetical protein [Streptomyces sp. R301]NML81446.1 hypothetical protein [Streptomyces sp. R302]